jgi:hypothetical protein
MHFSQFLAHFGTFAGLLVVVETDCWKPLGYKHAPQITSLAFIVGALGSNSSPLRQYLSESCFWPSSLNFICLETLEMQIVGDHCRPTEITWAELGTSVLSKPSRWLGHTLKFEKQRTGAVVSVVLRQLERLTQMLICSQKMAYILRGSNKGSLQSEDFTRV